MEVREVTMNTSSRIMAEVMRNRLMKDRHIPMTERAFITASTMPMVWSPS